MFKKLAFALSLVFGLSLFATSEKVAASDMPMQEMTEMADMSSDEAGGFSGSVELKYKNNIASSGTAGMGTFHYRARAGWTGAVNDSIKWGVNFSSNIEENFSGYVPKGIWLEQAYVKYAPVDNFWIKAGKSSKWSDHHVYGVLHDDDLYEEGVSAKFHNDFGDDMKFYVKAAAVYNGGSDEEMGGGHDNLAGPFKKGLMAKGKIGVKADMDVAMINVGVGGQSDALVTEGEGAAKHYGKAYVSVGSEDLGDSGIGAGVFAVGGTNMNFNKWSYTGGVYVGSQKPEEANDYSVSVSYYDVNSESWNTGQVDTDYIKPANGNGVAVRAQYNVWDDVSAVAKYAYAMNDSSQNAVVELTFDF